MSQIPDDSKIKIVLWSGGPDSTSCLIDLLQHTNEPVIAYHIFLYKDLGYNPNLNLYAAEYQQFDIVHQLHHVLQQIYRSFELRCYSMSIPQHTEPGIEIGLFPILDAITQNATVFTGRCTDDQAMHETNLNNTLFINRNNIARMFGINIIEYNYYHKTKKQIREHLGEYLWGLTISCIDPYVDGTPCGNCVRCQQRNITN